MHSDLLTDDDVRVLEDGRWNTIGFTGLFALVVELREPDGWPASEAALEEFEARLPARLPLGTNGSWLGLRIVDRMPNPTVLVVRTDAGALMDLVTRHR